MSLADSSFLNPILFPIWKKNKNKKVTFYLNHLIIMIILSMGLFLFNEYTLDLNQPFHIKLICVLLWIPLMFHGIGYSVFLYERKLNLYNILLITISAVFVLSFWIFKEFKAEGYIISRSISIFYGCFLVFLFNFKGIEFRFKFINIDYNLILNSLVRFANVNNFIVSVFLIRVIFSQFFLDDIAILNYALVIVFTFYTLINKNLNALAINESRINQLKASKIQIKYLSIYCFLLFLVLVALKYISSLSSIFINIHILIKIVQISIYFIPTILLCGIFDLYNSGNLLKSLPHYEKNNLFVVFSSLISFLILFICFD